MSNVAVLRFALPVEAGSRKPLKADVPGSTRTIAFSPPSVTQAAPSGPTMTPCGAEPSPSGISVVCPGRRVEPSEPAGVLGRVPDRPVGGGRDVVRVRSGGNRVLVDAEADGGRRGRSAQRPPLPRQHPSDDAEAAVPERPEDDRLALLERLPGRLLHDDAVRDEHGQLPGRGLRPEEPPRGADLRAPGVVVLGRDRVEERRDDGRAAECEPRGLERPAVRAREDLADGQPEPAHAAPDRTRVGAALGGEVPLRRAVGDDDGILVRLREVGGRVPEDERRARRRSGSGRGQGRSGGRAGDERQRERGDDCSDERAQ